MTHKEMLTYCIQNNVEGSQFYIAEELRDQLVDVYNIDISNDDRFEALCYLISEVFRKSEGISYYRFCKVMAKLESNYKEGRGPDPLFISYNDIREEAGWIED